MDYNLLPKTKYTTWYINLIETRLSQIKIKFKTEKHHIFPISIFNKNNKIVNLTYREHYIAHLLLVKIYENTKEYNKMSKALDMFISRKNAIKNSRLFEVHRNKYWLDESNRKAQSEKRKNYFSIQENKERHSKIMKKVTSTKEWRKQRSEKQKELISNDNYKQIRVNAMNSVESRKKSIETNKKNNLTLSKEELSEKYGRHKSDEQLIEQSNKIKGQKRVVHPTTKIKKQAKGEKLEQYLSKGYILWNDLTKEAKQLYKYI